MTAQIESRLRKLEAARQPDGPLADFTVAELQEIRRVLIGEPADTAHYPMLQRAFEAMSGKTAGDGPSDD